MIGALTLLVCAALTADPVVVDRDNVEVARSCTVRIEQPWIADTDGNGVIQITGEGITVDFSGAALRGAQEDQPADSFTGTGIRITGQDVTVRGARISGFKSGIFAKGANGLTLEDCDLSGNFRQRLKSTPEAEDSSDWLWPHANDDNQWLDRYGAAVYVEESRGVVLRRLKVRRGQNGIVLDRVEESEIYDNDCSFLSGWGLALWRSSRNMISRNAFDFCIRGYSHGVYNRGQDSAGILLFEQCSDNIITENSATHCGDGLFCFAGREALGQVRPRDDSAWYAGRGCNRNVILDNDFSYSAAHGVEITFSFGNQVIANRMIGNAICGIWGGYSQDTYIAGNTFVANGDMPYGSERGGINIEHGRGNRIEHNRFATNACGVYLWWDEDESLLATPWCRTNEKGSSDNVIAGNTFSNDGVAIQLRRARDTAIGENRYVEVGKRLDADEESLGGKRTAAASPLNPPDLRPLGQERVIGKRRHLRGRKHIVITEWGPRDWEEE